MGRNIEGFDWGGHVYVAVVGLALYGLFVLCVFAAAWAIAAASGATAQGGDHCHPATARATQIVYKPTGHNTWVTLIAYCDGTAPTAWSISFFEGEQPSLWDWWEIQNTASELLRGY